MKKSTVTDVPSSNIPVPRKESSVELPGTVRDVAKSMEVAGSVTTLFAPTAHTHPAQLSKCRKQRKFVCLTE